MNDEFAAHPTPARADVDPPTFPLSFAQQRLWVLDRLEPGNTAYNVGAAYRIDGTLEVGALKASCREIVRRHDALRTVFRDAEGGPCQVVLDEVLLRIPLVDLSQMLPSEQETELQRQMMRNTGAPFDLAQGPLIRMWLFKLGSDGHVLLFANHHIVCDGWSRGVLLGELLDLYAAFSRGKPSPLDELELQYPEFARRQRAVPATDAFADDLAYWHEQLAGAPSSIALPTDRPQPPQRTIAGGARTMQLSPATTRAAASLGDEQGATLFTTLLTAWSVFLHRYCSENDISIGVPVAARNQADIESLIGFFVNTLVLRADLSSNPTFREALGRVHDTSRAALKHQRLPFETLVEKLRPNRDASRTPLFQVMLVFQNVPMPPLERCGLRLRQIEVDRDTAMFDLTLQVRPVDEGLRLTLEYNASLFDPATVDRMLEHFRHLLAAATADPDARIGDLELASPAERQRVIYEWNDTATNEVEEGCLATLFERQATRTPNAVAVRYGTLSSTYAALDERADRLAWHLADLGVGPGTPIGLGLERSLDAVVGILGILKAGAAWVPLGPTLPRERLEFMVEDAAIPLVVADTRWKDRFEQLGSSVLCVDQLPPPAGETPPAALTGHGDAGHRPRPDDLAYVIYTSGSMGQPKGVLGLHGGMINRLRWARDVDPFEPGEVCCQKTSLSFVDSIAEIFAPLLAGVPLVIFPDDTVKDPAALIEALAAHRVTRIVVVPALFRRLLEHDDIGRRLPQLRRWTSSGETLSADLRERFRERLPGARLWNVYGASEASADSLWHEIGDSDTAAFVPLGRPIRNTRAYILDERMCPTPIGVAGELCIGGAGLARGYLNRPDLTARRFLPDPFSGRREDRIYKTGDLARWLPDGSIQLLGRHDNQVKVRGHRVELGEAEVVLRRHPQVANAVVFTRPTAANETALIAAIEPAAGDVAGTRARAAVDPKALRSWMRERLPDYFVPSAFVLVDELPKTDSGKIDRRAAAAIEVDETEPLQPGDVAPRTDMERRLAKIWTQVLATHPRSVHDDFFDLGGHSLAAIDLLSRVEDGTGRRLRLGDLIESPTIATLAEALSEPRDQQPTHALIKLNEGGTKAPFFWVPAIHILGYETLTELLDDDRPLYGLHDQRLEHGGAERTRIGEIASRYIVDIRSVQPVGPYLIGGFCFGGIVAFEMARQLGEQGEETRLLVLVESYGPSAWIAPRTALGRWWRSIRNQASTIRLLEPAARLRYCRHLLARAITKAHIAVDGPRGQALHEVRAANRVAARRYSPPSTYDGALTLIKASANPSAVNDLPKMGWEELAGGPVQKHQIHGHHLSLFREPSIHALAATLRGCLDRVGD